ncbi:MAG: hypothetical protein D6677_12175 [Calditrichaeota bacterium]|nr:MAG: hypothetical protein D6677_12175 [Calditrichota bacterium]
MEEPQKLNLDFVLDANGNRVCTLCIQQRDFVIHAGSYRLVYGVPRKFWPAPTPNGGIVFVENYEYELGKVVNNGFLQNLKRDYDKLGWGYRESFEISGQFDPEGACWKQGARALFHDPGTGSVTTVALPQWRFTLYEGDLLYDSLGRLISAWNEDGNLTKQTE